MPCAPPPSRGFYGGGGSSGGGGLGLFSGKGGGKGFFSGKGGGGGGGFFRRRGSDDPPHTNGGSGVNGSSMSTNGGVDPAGLREQLIMAHSRNSDSSFAYAGSRTPAQPATEAIPCHVLERLYQECVEKYERGSRSCESFSQRLSNCAPPMPSHNGGRNRGVTPKHFGDQLALALGDDRCYHAESLFQGCVKKYGHDYMACQLLKHGLYNCSSVSTNVTGSSGVAPEYLESCYNLERVYQGCLKKYGSDHIACQRVNLRLFNCRQRSSLVGGMVP